MRRRTPSVEDRRTSISRSISLAATEANNLARCTPERTVAVINTNVLPNSEMIRNVRAVVSTDSMTAAIMAVVDQQRSFTSDARTIAETLFGDYMVTNMVMIGAAYQRGFLPISAQASRRRSA